MNINKVMYKPNFGRAFTSKEKRAYSDLLKDTRTALNLEDTSAIVFDFNVPSEKGKNTAIGTTWSYAMEPFIKFIKDMTGITSVQLAPQGKINYGNTSPYSGTTFAFGEHIIDLSKLASADYANLLPEDYIKSLDNNYTQDKNTREYRTDYPYVLGSSTNTGIQKEALHIAFDNFLNALEEGNESVITLNKEFSDFKKENSQWLEKESLFVILTKIYGNDDFENWSDIDRELFSTQINEDTRERRITQLREENKYDIEFEEFIQFIASKQQKESHTNLNTQNIKLYGDCLIGFSRSEMWANKDCFRKNLYYGGPDPGCEDTNYIQTWGLPALDYTKLGECEDPKDLTKLDIVGKLLYDKYTTFFKRYDGIRVDAAWQFVTPFIYQAINGTYEEVKLPEINNTIFNIMNAAADKAKSEKEIMLELVGISADKSRQKTLNKYPHLYSTAYAEYDESPAKFLEKGYKDGMFYTGTGNHDNDSLANMARDKEKRTLHMNGIKRDYNLNESSLKYSSKEYTELSEEDKIQEDFKTAKLAETYTAKKQFFTLPDMFGMSERINISGRADENNWTVRIPSDYEKFYFSQLSNGYGINMPKVLAVALSMKQGNKYQDLISKCNEAAEILRQKGPMTQEEADKLEREGKLQNTFQYLS